jgi:hypothetical protein
MAKSLVEQVQDGSKRKAVIEDALRVLDAEVDDKSGLSGIAVKTAYKLVKGIAPGFLSQVMDRLLDDFLKAVDPVYQEAVAKGEAPSKALTAQGGAVADRLLAVTDARAARAKQPVVLKTYEKLRPSAKKHVEAAMPRLGQLIERHVASA